MDSEIIQEPHEVIPTSPDPAGAIENTPPSRLEYEQDVRGFHIKHVEGQKPNIVPKMDYLFKGDIQEKGLSGRELRLLNDTNKQSLLPKSQTGQIPTGMEKFGFDVIKLKNGQRVFKLAENFKVGDNRVDANTFMKYLGMPKHAAVQSQGGFEYIALSKAQANDIGRTYGDLARAVNNRSLQ